MLWASPCLTTLRQALARRHGAPPWGRCQGWLCPTQSLGSVYERWEREIEMETERERSKGEKGKEELAVMKLLLCTTPYAVLAQRPGFSDVHTEERHTW